MNPNIMCPERGCNHYLEDKTGPNWIVHYNDQQASARGVEEGHHYMISYKCPNPECGKAFYRRVVLHEDVQ